MKHFAWVDTLQTRATINITTQEAWCVIMTPVLWWHKSYRYLLGGKQKWTLIRVAGLYGYLTLLPAYEHTNLPSFIENYRVTITKLRSIMEYLLPYLLEARIVSIETQDKLSRHDFSRGPSLREGKLGMMSRTYPAKARRGKGTARSPRTSRLFPSQESKLNSTLCTQLLIKVFFFHNSMGAERLGCIVTVRREMDERVDNTRIWSYEAERLYAC